MFHILLFLLHAFLPKCIFIPNISLQYSVMPRHALNGLINEHFCPVHVHSQIQIPDRALIGPEESSLPSLHFFFLALEMSVLSVKGMIQQSHIYIPNSVAFTQLISAVYYLQQVREKEDIFSFGSGFPQTQDFLLFNS